MSYYDPDECRTEGCYLRDGHWQRCTPDQDTGVPGGGDPATGAPPNTKENTMPHARLPEDHLEMTLANLPHGPQVWVVPWAVRVDRDRNMWLNVEVTWQNRPHGTVQMEVKRREDGFHVSLPRDYRWSLSPRPHGDQWVPVAGILR